MNKYMIIYIMLRYITIFIILTVLGIFNEKYKLKYENDEELDKYDLVKKLSIIFIINIWSILDHHRNYLFYVIFLFDYT